MEITVSPEITTDNCITDYTVIQIKSTLTLQSRTVWDDQNMDNSQRMLNPKRARESVLLWAARFRRELGKASLSKDETREIIAEVVLPPSNTSLVVKETFSGDAVTWAWQEKKNVRSVEMILRA